MFAGPLLAVAAAFGQVGQGLESGLAQLQKEPRNLELRRKIIETVRSMPALPAMPEEASEAKGWADTALKDAKSAADYREAARAYEKALLLAPWAADCYRGLSSALEKAGLYEDAAANLRLYLLSSPGARDAQQASERIGALAYQARKPLPAAPLDAELVARLKKAVSVGYKAAYECGRYPPVEALRKRERMSCDLEEYNAGRWHGYEALGTFEFRFPEDGTIQFWNSRPFGSVLEMVGAPRGPRPEDVEWRRCDERGECSRRLWALLSEDLGSLTFSVDRPADDSRLDARARYAYTKYRKQ